MADDSSAAMSHELSPPPPPASSEDHTNDRDRDRPTTPEKKKSQSPAPTTTVKSPSRSRTDTVEMEHDTTVPTTGTGDGEMEVDEKEEQEGKAEIKTEKEKEKSPTSKPAAVDKPSSTGSGTEEPRPGGAAAAEPSEEGSDEWRAKSPHTAATEEGQTTRRSSDAQATTAPTEKAPSVTTATPSTGSRKQMNGTIGSVYSGNKIRHLKKDDGIPLWRKDIQYKFLRLVFEDETPVFTRVSDADKGHSFADVYLDTMARSSRTSRVLKDKLQNDRKAAINIAMVCLLVNFGRMNTTLNFFPEMRAQLRTYHSIPSLQAHQDPSAYKQLQDAPRLKSILKGASEDTEQPGSVEKIKSLPIPRTNPVNLIFVLAQYAPKISEIHFNPPRDFFDLVMCAELSSKSRARAFLWLMWFYLESDFTEQAGLDNPFGPGLVGEGTDGKPFKVPGLETLTEEEGDAENVDTPEEIRFGEERRIERKRILEEDDVVFRHIKRQKKEYMSDDQASEDVPSAPPSVAGGKGTKASFRSEAASTSFTPLNPSKRSAEDLDREEHTPAPPSRPRAKRAKRESSTNRANHNQPQRLVLKTKMEQTPDTASPAPPGAAHPVLSQFGNGSPAAGLNPAPRRPRPMTQHQLALEQNRKQRVEYALSQQRLESWKTFRAQREEEIPFARATRLLQRLPDDYDTDDERSWGKGGVCPNPKEEEDFGEAADFYFSVVRKMARRLQRWDWDALISDEKDVAPNGLGREYNSRPIEEPREPEVVNQPPPSTSKVKSRATQRRERKSAVEAGGETGKQNGTTRRSRASGAGGRKPAGERAKRRPRASKGGAAKREEPQEEAHDVEAPSTVNAPTGRRRKSGRQEGTGALDEFDKELLGELSRGEENGPSLPEHEHLHQHHQLEDDNDASSLPPPPPHPLDDDDTEELSDVDMEMSNIAGNGYSDGGESSYLDHEDDTVHHEDEGDETIMTVDG